MLINQYQVQLAANLKANLASPTWYCKCGTKKQWLLGNVDNISDANKPISTAEKL
jgi:hypothetical protein